MFVHVQIRTCKDVQALSVVGSVECTLGVFLVCISFAIVVCYLIILN